MKSLNHYRYAHVVTKAPEMLADIINTSISHFPELKIKCNTYVYARVMADFLQLYLLWILFSKTSMMYPIMPL